MTICSLTACALRPEIRGVAQQTPLRRVRGYGIIYQTGARRASLPWDVYPSGYGPTRVSVKEGDGSVEVFQRTLRPVASVASGDDRRTLRR